MPILNDRQIRERCGGTSPMLSPFVLQKTRVGALSFGLGHFGYDIRISDIIRKPVANEITTVIDPLNAEHLGRQRFVDAKLDEEFHFALHPDEFVLSGTLEYFRIPKDIVAVVHDKSTLARLGVAVQNTVLEPGWEGHLTVEITNHGVNTIMLSASMPIAQVIFYSGEAPDHAYEGKYQHQRLAEVAKA